MILSKLFLVSVTKKLDHLIKQVLAGEGDAVIIDNGNVYLNGIKVAEPVRGRQEESGRQEYILSPGQYFLIGENLEVSLDSRVFGQIEKSAVRGIVIGNLF
ncbi:signal peptidase IB [Lachnospiraceae bacterium]|nr:signal peptidase IB [Lachnospiraceae bacterium]